MTQHQEQLERDVRKLKDEVQSKDFDLQEMGQLREDMKTLQAEKEKLLSEQAKSQEISAENAHVRFYLHYSLVSFVIGLE